MLGVNGRHLPRFNFVSNVANGRSIHLIHMMIVAPIRRGKTQ